MLFLWLLCGFVAVLLVEAAPVQVSLVYKHKLGGKFAQAGEVTASLHDGQARSHAAVLLLSSYGSGMA